MTEDQLFEKAQRIADEMDTVGDPDEMSIPEWITFCEFVIELARDRIEAGRADLKRMEG